LGEPFGQGWLQIFDLAVALFLSAIIGLEREVRQKSAGLRTHTVIGFSSALIMLVSKYGFSDVVGQGVVLDPSRVAAQIVSGIGFIGGGLIFVRRDSVRGLTTAAGIWVTAAIGTAAGANLPLLATTTTVLYLVVSVGFPLLSSHLPTIGPTESTLRLTYRDGEGVLRRLVARCAELGFAVCDLVIDRNAPPDEGTVTVEIVVRGRGPAADLAGALDNIDGVLVVRAGETEREGDV
jgi:putative Mg2+ transporter-C (MgtC) family protein